MNTTIHPQVEYLKNTFPCDYETDLRVLTSNATWISPQKEGDKYYTIQPNGKILTIKDNTAASSTFSPSSHKKYTVITRIDPPQGGRNSAMYKMQYKELMLKDMDDTGNVYVTRGDDHDDELEKKRTDLVDYVVLNGLENIRRTLNINTSDNDYTSDFVRHCLSSLRGYQVERQGPMGIVTFLEKSSSLCFGKLLCIHLFVVDEIEMRNILINEVWQRVEITKRRILRNLPKQRLSDPVFQENVQYFEKALHARKPIFVYDSISLYERAVVLANAWLMIYNFVYFAVSRINEDTDFYGHSMVKLLSLYNNNSDIRPDFSLPQDDCSEEFKALVINGNHEIYIDVRMKVDAFETVTKEILAKEYRTLNLIVSPRDKRLKISPFILKDLILCTRSQFQELDQRLQRRRVELRLPLRTCLPHGKNPPPPIIDTNDERIKINREIRIADTESSCTYPSSDDASRDIAYIYRYSIATTPLNYTLKFAGNKSNMEDNVCDDLWISFLEDNVDDIEDAYYGDVEEEEVGDILTSWRDECDYDVAYIEYIQQKMRGDKTFCRAYTGYLAVWEDLGPLLTRIVEPRDGNLEMKEISERVREAMAIDDICRGISLLNRFEVRFSGSKYTLSPDGQIKYNLILI